MTIEDIKKVDLLENTNLLQEVKLSFSKEKHTNVFCGYSSKRTLRQIVNTPKSRFFKLNSKVGLEYKDDLFRKDIGKFLLELKTNNDSLYKQFLNTYGDSTYSVFGIDDEKVLSKKGIYFYTLEDEIKYIGRCRDTFKKRINSGYGKISPKNCFKDGQSTNCRINSTITKYKDNIKFWVYELDDNKKIEDLELELISSINPEWNCR